MVPMSAAHVGCEREDLTAETPGLPEGLNALAGILALRPAGFGQNRSDALATLLDVLVAALHLDAACGRLAESAGEPALDVARLPRHIATSSRPEDVCRALEPWLSRDPPAWLSRVAHPAGPGEVWVARINLGLQDDLGVLVAASSRPDFPTDVERFLLQVASTQ